MSAARPGAPLAGTVRMASNHQRVVPSGAPSSSAFAPLLGQSTHRSNGQSSDRGTIGPSFGACKPFDRNRAIIWPTSSSKKHGPLLYTLQDDDDDFDIVLLCPNENASAQPNKLLHKRRKTIAARARFIGLKVSIEVSRDNDEKLIKLTAPDPLLEEMAEKISMEKKLRSGGYTDFTREAKKLFLPASEAAFFSSSERIRLVLAILELSLSEGGCDIDLDLEIERNVLTAVVPIHDGSAAAALLQSWCLAPLHWWPQQPLDEVRDYFGEQISMYFAFVQCLTRSLIAPSLVGLVVVSAALIYGSTDNPLCPLYSIFILIWINGFCKQWRREEARLAFRWNVEDYEETERQRPEFRGEEARGFYSAEGYFIDIEDDDKHVAAAPVHKKFTRAQRAPRIAISYGIILPVVFAVVCGAIAVLAYRSFLQVSLSAARVLALGFAELDFEETKNGLPSASDMTHLRIPPSYAATIGSVIGGALNSVFISITNFLYAIAARKLNDWENHRTETQYEDALILKTFCFQFINSYVSLFYIAFIKAAQLHVLPSGILAEEYCHDLNHFTESVEQIKQENDGLNPYCMGELSTMLTSLVIFTQLSGKLAEYVTPWISALWRMWSEELGMRLRGAKIVDMSPYEEQCKLEPFEGVFSEYSKIIIQIGYIVLFAPAFPIASLVCYVSFLFEIRTDAYKLLVNTQRPRYAGAQDIGSWQKVLWAIGVIGVFTNVGLIGYTSTSFSHALPVTLFGDVQITAQNKVVFLFLFEHLVLAAQYVVLMILPDYPETLAIIRARQHWRKRATVELFRAQGKPVIVDGPNNPPRPPPIKWDDEEIPERFWKDHTNRWMEPRQVREWSRMIKAGGWLMEMQASEREARKTIGDSYADAKYETMRASVRASAQIEEPQPNDVPKPAALPPPACPGHIGCSQSPSPTKRSQSLVAIEDGDLRA